MHYFKIYYFYNGCVVTDSTKSKSDGNTGLGPDFNSKC